MSILNSIITNTKNKKSSTSEITVVQTAAKVAKKELRENEQNRKDGLAQIITWIKNNDDIENIRTDESFLLRFLRVKKFNLQLVQQMLLKYLNLKRILAHLTTELDFLSPNLNAIISSGYLFPSPCRDKHGRRVIIGSAKNFDARQYTASDMAKIHFLTYETLLCDPINQILGFTHIGDFNGITIGHITIWNPTDFTRVLKWAEQSIPMRHKEIHLVNVGTGVKWVIDVCKGRFSGKMTSRLQTHSSIDDLKKKFSPDILPIEMGGTKYTIQEMIEMWKQELAQNRDEIIALDKMRILDDRGIIGRRHDKSCKNNKFIICDKVAGNFRKLEFD